MTDLKSELLEADKRSFEENGGGVVEEEGFYCYGSGGGVGCGDSREDGFNTPASSQHQTWSPTLEDLDDSGHFTASPDGEKALSGSSRSHSPCPLSSAHLLLQMQHQQQKQDSSISAIINSQFHQPLTQSCLGKQLQQPPTQKDKTLISPRSVMTMKVPQQGSAGVPPNLLQEDSSRPVTYTLHSFNGKVMEAPPKVKDSNELPSSVSSTLQFSHMLQQSSLLPIGASGGGDGDASSRNSSDVPCDYLRQIIRNFNSLYIEKLKMIDNLVVDGSMNEEERKLVMDKKTNILENWAKDVCIQNMALVHTVEELEKEAGGKVVALQKKMIESTQLAKEHMTSIKKYEEQVKLLLKNYTDSETVNSSLNLELEILKKECRRERERINWLLKDNDALLTLVCRIRDMGVWDISGLEFQRASFDQIFGLYPSLMGSEVQTVFTREKAKHVKETEAKAVKLEEELDIMEKSRREAQNLLLERDRKIEDLEIEIKNVLNKAQYSERECNEYKMALLATQEKLLEATKRLVSSVKQPNSNGIDGEENEMTELIKELREVKSQLNTAIEEKQVAKDESVSFKMELSERLKEMHDIQNAFQSLATEVVSSRVAFQQVQEMEVQMQSLKSQIQTYQSRCANADDTILKKEKEIKRLQQQMNDIHKRKSKSAVNSPRGKIPVIQNKTKPSKSPRTYTNITPTWDSTPPHQQPQDTRPPWNIHFKKSTGVLGRPPPELPSVQNQKFPKVFTPSSRSQSSLTRNNSFSKAEIASSGNGKAASNFLTLPKIDNKEFRSYRPKQQSASATVMKISGAAENGMKRGKLPFVQQDTRGSIQSQTPKGSNASISNSNGPGPGPGHTYFNNNFNPNNRQQQHPPVSPRINELINVVVETSQRLMGQGDASGNTKDHHRGGRGFSVTGAYYRRHKERKNDETVHTNTNLRRTKSNDKYTDRNRSKDDADKKSQSSYIVTKFHSLPEVAGGVDSQRNKKQYSQETDDGNDNASKGESVELVYRSPPNVQEYLSNLPEESIENLVNSWIKKSPSQTSSMGSTNKARQKIAKSMPPVAGRQSSVRIMKHLATRRCPKPASVKSNKSSLARATENLVDNQMFELEHEWGQVFANLESNAGHRGERARANANKPFQAAAAAGSEEVSEVVVDKPCGASRRDSIRSLKEECSSVTSTTSDFASARSQATPNYPITEQSNETKCQELESMRELLNRVTKEKQEMEERLRRELEDKDIELTMQKVTIQHLQDAYVALKRGQPIPVPQNATGNKIAVNGGGSAIGNGHHHKINNNNNNIMDV